MTEVLEINLFLLPSLQLRASTNLIGYMLLTKVGRGEEVYVKSHLSLGHTYQG